MDQSTESSNSAPLAALNVARPPQRPTKQSSPQNHAKIQTLVSENIYYATYPTDWVWDGYLEWSGHYQDNQHPQATNWTRFTCNDSVRHLELYICRAVNITIHYSVTPLYKMIFRDLNGNVIMNPQDPSDSYHYYGYAEIVPGHPSNQWGDQYFKYGEFFLPAHYRSVEFVSRHATAYWWTD